MYELLNTALKQTPKELRRYNLQFPATVLSYESVPILCLFLHIKIAKLLIEIIKILCFLLSIKNMNFPLLNLNL